MPRAIITEFLCAFCGKRFTPTTKQRYRSRRGSKSYCCKTHRYGGELLERFLSHTRRLENGCLEWTGAVGGDGYAKMRVDGKKRAVAHVAWFLHYGEWPPPDKKTDHICHDPKICAGGDSDPHRRCAEWSHLKLVTNKENCSPDRAGSPRRSMEECSRHHPFTPENTYYRPDRPGSRICRTCAGIRTEAWKRRKTFR